MVELPETTFFFTTLLPATMWFAKKPPNSSFWGGVDFGGVFEFSQVSSFVFKVRRTMRGGLRKRRGRGVGRQEEEASALGDSMKRKEHGWSRGAIRVGGEGHVEHPRDNYAERPQRREKTRAGAKQRGAEEEERRKGRGSPSAFILATVI